MKVGVDGAVTVLWLLIRDLTERSCDWTRRKKGKRKREVTSIWLHRELETFRPPTGKRVWCSDGTQMCPRDAGVDFKMTSLRSHTEREVTVDASASEVWTFQSWFLFWSNSFPQDPQVLTHSPIWVLYSPCYLETSKTNIQKNLNHLDWVFLKQQPH